jgi:hypothetical protein
MFEDNEVWIRALREAHEAQGLTPTVSDPDPYRIPREEFWMREMRLAKEANGGKV